MNPTESTAPQGDAELTTTSPAAAPALGLTAAELEELDNLLDDLRTRGEEIPQWEFCDGFMTAVICSRRPIAPCRIPAHAAGRWCRAGSGRRRATAAAARLCRCCSKRAFWNCRDRRWNEIVTQLDTDVKTLDDERTFQPEAMDMRGAVASLPEAERAEMEGQEIPSFGQVWALGFMFAVENWPEDWAAPRDKEAAQWLDDALDSIVALTEDDTGKPEVCMYNEDGPPSTSQARVEAFGEAIWAVYDLRQLWKSMGPRVETLRKAPRAWPQRSLPLRQRQEVQEVPRRLILLEKIATELIASSA